MNSVGKLTPIQMELLKVYSFVPSEKELQDVKSILAGYFAQRLSANAQQAADANGISEADLDAWLNGKQ